MRKSAFSTVFLAGIAAAFLILTSTVFATDRLVPSQYSTIQAAIDDCNNGDVVIIEPNTYTGTGNRNLDFGGKAITVRSTDPNDPDVVAATVIDCQNVSGRRGFYFHSGEGPNSIVSGLTIKRGKVNNKGGGIYCSGSSPTIENCIITNNLAYGSVLTDIRNAYGGGIYCQDSSPTIRNCIIDNNKTYAASVWDDREDGSPAYGGGIYCTSSSNPAIIDCTISNNTVRGGDGADGTSLVPAGDGGRGYGGGIYCSSVTVNNTIINNNTARGGNGGAEMFYGPGLGGSAYGGGIYGAVTISDSIVSDNLAYGGDGGFPGRASGGGIYSGNATVDNCLIVNNAADDALGGIWWHYGGGIYAGNLTASNCTIYNNSAYEAGGGVYCSSGGTIIDSILWGNDDDLYGCSATYSCIEDGDAGTGNISADPCFVTGPDGDFYLSQTAAGQAVDSPCVDAGSDTAANLGMDVSTTRTDGLMDMGVVDMGYHYSVSLGSADIDENWHVDFFDFALFAAGWRQCDYSNNLAGDLNRDWCVESDDLGLLVDCWLDCYVGQADNPSPYNNAPGVDPNGVLEWAGGDGALYHDVYFGSDVNAVAEANHFSPEFMDTISDSNFDPCTLEPNTTYYWRIDEVGPACMVEGSVWSFTTMGEFDPNLDLVSWWEFDEGEGDTAYDSAGDNHGTIYGATWTTGQINGTLDFDGDQDYIFIPDSDSISVGNKDYTICAWVYPRTTFLNCIVSKVKDGADKEYAFSTDYGELKFTVEKNSNDQYAVTTTTPVSTNSWQHVVVTFDSSSTLPTFYHNGQFQESSSNIDTLPDELSDDLYIGMLGGVYFDYEFDGLIDDVRIYDRVLSAGDIWQLYQDGLNN